MPEIILPDPGEAPNWGNKMNLAVQTISDAVDAIPEEIVSSESDLGNAVRVVIAENSADPFHTSYDYFIGDDTEAVRPDYSGPVRWLTTVEVKPTNTRLDPPAGTGLDSWAFVEPDPVPDVFVWSDDFNRADNPAGLGTTTLGSKTWVNTPGSGGDGVIGISANAAKVIAGTTGTSVRAVIDNGAARGLFQVTIAATANSLAAVSFRYIDDLNNFTLARVSSGNHHYRLVRYVASSTAVQIKEFSVEILAGDVVIIDDRVAGALQIKINGTVQFDEIIDGLPATQHLAATKVALYAGQALGALNSRWEDASFYRVGP